MRLELGVVALPFGQVLVRDVQHLGDGVVEQVQIVAHHEQRAGEPGQLVEQPPLGRTVEVVGRLVEDEQLGLLEEHADQVDPPALATRERLDVLEEELLAQARAVGQAGHHRLGLVTPVLLELLLEVGEELDVLRRGVVGHAPTGIAQRIVEHVETAGGEDVGEPGGLEPQSPGDRCLGQVAEGAEQADIALVAQLGGGLPDQDRDERRLAGPVSPDQPHLLARAHDEGGIREERAVANFDGESRSDDHAPLYGREVSPGYTPQMAALDRKWWTLIAVCTAIFMLLLDITVVNVALPDIQRSLNASFSDLQWVVDAYSLTLAAFLLTAGVAGDIYGRRKIFALGLVVFSLASLVCGLSTTPLMLNLARAVQGVGGAIMFATSLALIAAAFTGKDRGTAFGVYGAVIGGAVAIGPLIGGAITSGIGWRWIFFVNVPIGVVAVFITFTQIAKSTDLRAAPDRLGRVSSRSRSVSSHSSSRSCGGTTSAGAARRSSASWRRRSSSWWCSS